MRQVHASVKQKRGKRSLFYDLSLVLNWRAEYAGPQVEHRPATLRRPI